MVFGSDFQMGAYVNTTTLLITGSKSEGWEGFTFGDRYLQLCHKLQDVCCNDFSQRLWLKKHIFKINLKYHKDQLYKISNKFK